jgi:hypothetical protein
MWSKVRSFGGTVAQASVGSNTALKLHNAKRSAIFNEPEYGGDRSYGLGWDAHPNAKIVVFGLPKSGNVWLKSLLADYFRVPGINIFNQLNEKGVGITHMPFSDGICARDDIIHGACIIRDIRDVISSYYHYSQTERFRSARRDFQYTDIYAFYYDWFLPIVVAQHRVHSFAAEYAELGVPVVRYERLYDDPMDELRKLVLRWGSHFDEAHAHQIVDANSLDNLKKSGKTLEIHVDKSHFRKGGYGDYKETLPQRIIQDIGDRFGALQKRWGYE